MLKTINAHQKNHFSNDKLQNRATILTFRRTKITEDLCDLGQQTEPDRFTRDTAFNVNTQAELYKFVAFHFERKKDNCIIFQYLFFSVPDRLSFAAAPSNNCVGMWE